MKLFESNPSLPGPFSSHRGRTIIVQRISSPNDPIPARRVMMRHHGQFHEQADAGARKSLVEGPGMEEKKAKAAR